MQSPRSSTILLLSLFLSGTLASDSDLVGCNELGCPPEGPSYKCTVSDTTFNAIGEAPIPGVPDALKGVSLVKGVEVGGLNLTGSNTADTKNRPFKSVYYLGTPSDLQTGDISGCAVVFSLGSTKTFSGDERESSTGTCPDVIDQKCINALTDRAAQVSDCSALSRALKNDQWDECKDMTGKGAGLGNFTVTSLSHLSPITKAQNSSSDCWPVPDKSFSLAQITSNTTMGDYRPDAIFENMLNISPVLTVFRGGNGANTGLDETVTQLTCLKALAPVNQETKDREIGDDPGESNAPKMFSRNSLGAAVVVLAAMMFTGF